MAFNDTATAANASIDNNNLLFFVGSSSAGNATVTNDGTVKFEGTSVGGTSTFTNGAAGVLNISEHTGTGVAIGSLAGSGTVTLGTKSLTVGTNGQSTTFGGAIGGTGAFSKEGTGTLTLSGTSSYTGATAIVGGMLAVNGSIAASSGVTVNTGGTLGGTGSVSSVTIRNGGTLAPGNSIGTIDVTGNVAFGAGSTYAVEVSPTDADRTNATGTASLAGTVAAAFQPGSYVARTYTILNAAGGVSGTFDALTTTNLPAGFAASLSYTANDAILNLTAQLAQQLPPGSTGNLVSLSNTINAYFNTGGTLPPGFAALFGFAGPQLDAALKQVAGEASGQGGSEPGVQLGSAFMQLLLNGYAGSRGAGGGFGPAAAGFAPESPRPAAVETAYAAIDRAIGANNPFASRHSIWASGYGGQADTRGDAAAGTSDMRARTYGFAVGLDQRLGADTVAGFSLAGGSTNWQLAGGLGKGSGDAFQAGLFATHKAGRAYFSAAAAYGWHDMRTDRIVSVAGSDALRATFDAHSFGGRLEAGYRVSAPMALAVTPYAAAQVQAYVLPSYSEMAVTGSNQFALSFRSRTTTATRAELGAWFDTREMFPEGGIQFFGRAAWAHDWQGGHAATAAFQALPGTSFTVSGGTAPSDLAMLTAGAEVRLSPAVTLAAKFDGEFADGYRSYSGTGTLRVAW